MIYLPVALKGDPMYLGSGDRSLPLSLGLIYSDPILCGGKDINVRGAGVGKHTTRAVLFVLMHTVFVEGLIWAFRQGLPEHPIRGKGDDANKRSGSQGMRAVHAVGGGSGPNIGSMILDRRSVGYGVKSTLGSLSQMIDDQIGSRRQRWTAVGLDSSIGGDRLVFSSPSHGFAWQTTQPFRIGLGNAAAGSCWSINPISGRDGAIFRHEVSMWLSSGTWIRFSAALLLIVPYRHEVALDRMLGVMVEAGVFASDGGICWAITELVEMLSVGRMMASKRYWGPFFPLFQKSVAQSGGICWALWVLVSWLAEGVVLLGLLA